VYLLDTDTIIYSLKGQAAVVRNLEAHRHDPLKVCVATLMELYYGAYKSQRAAANLARVRRIAEAFDPLPVDDAIAETFGMLKSMLESHGTPLDDLDLVIVACALAHNLTLVTNNEKHFRRVDGLRLDNWTRV